MKKARIGVCDVEIYDSIEELPVSRWHKYQKYCLIDGGIGSDLSSIDTHIARVGEFIRQKAFDKADTELQNLRQNIFFVQNDVNLRLLSYACLIKSIDGEECNDITDEGLQRVIDRLADVPTNTITAIFMVVKKKIEQEVQAYFPSLLITSGEKEFANLVRAHTLEVLKDIQGCGDKRKIEELHAKIVTNAKPIQFTGENNYEIDFDKQFERLSIVLAQQMHIDSKKCSVMEFYNAYEVIKEQSKAKQNGRHK